MKFNLGGQKGLAEDNTIEENERLRKRNQQLEEELRRLNDQFFNQAGSQAHAKPSQAAYRPMSVSSQEIEELRREKAQLKEENEKVMRMVKESGQYDVYMLRKENERLQKVIKEFENNYGAVSPESGDSKVLSQKIVYYEKAIRQLEAERSELLSRATMAEEQLKNLEKDMKRVVTEYQQNIIKLKNELKSK